MIFVTGDCHADFGCFNTKLFPEQKTMTKSDYVIICGDFGGVWNREKEDGREKWWMDWLEDKPFTTLFVDGNHENFDRLNSYPVEKWNGGNVHKIRPSVIHLMRGQVFELQGKKIFAFGGAASHDIAGGILELDDPDFIKKAKWMNREGIPYRINHLSWWSEEKPSKEEMEEGIRNLEIHGNEVDFIVSHCCATSTQTIVGKKGYQENELTGYFEGIKQKVTFNKWFFGHYHDNICVNEKEILVYEKIIQIV